MASIGCPNCHNSETKALFSCEKCRQNFCDQCANIEDIDYGKIFCPQCGSYLTVESVDPERVSEIEQ